MGKLCGRRYCQQSEENKSGRRSIETWKFEDSSDIIQPIPRCRCSVGSSVEKRKEPKYKTTYDAVLYIYEYIQGDFQMKILRVLTSEKEQLYLEI